MKSSKQLLALSLLLIALMVGGGVFFSQLRIKNSGSALYQAASLGRTAEALALIESGVQVNFIDLWADETPLHGASESGNDAIVTALLAHGAKIEMTSKNGFTPLGYAALSGRVSTVKLLLSKGANPQARNIFGHTPIEEVQIFLRVPSLPARKKVAYPQVVAILSAATRDAK